MNRFRQTIFVLASAVAWISFSCAAQPAAGTAQISKSPVAIFRELLAMSPADRASVLAVRPPDVQKRILQKLQEYVILPPELREMRLRETDLRWYLRPLLDEPRTNRTARLALIPEEERSLVAERLQLWDLLPPPLQERWKDDDTIASYFAQIQSATDGERQAILDQIPRERQAELRKGLDRWAAMSEEERQKTLARFNRMFELSPNEKEKALDTVSEEERQQMEQTLADYGKLTSEQRAQCSRSFEKFFSLSIADRQQFLQNANYWLKMTPEERQKWRDLVSVAPIMPPMSSHRVRIIPLHSQQQSGPDVAATN